ncbi:hypothetical protein SAMD00019534_073320 [Acytostelium subglobosum LB1]|uniref:hypothetical protein n=1 Tax=Acytostelium subglobosum LB1 TaxID=1410327 RepID=UPI0006451622|nr:hypothetical protein SAMD00019534_073320 [Acytostelium subglobosum LB1]GAM24157.1 hypothetical protein SAMD00019534_073320 [Acytostelium subglobosum LB1]|eukprot:XP_012753193.1 hypothetical protein SAMD00019534_073320 [Acytostelium subglobosum LB1]
MEVDSKTNTTSQQTPDDDTIVESQQQKQQTTDVDNQSQQQQQKTLTTTVKNRIKQGDTVILNINNGETYRIIKLDNDMKQTFGKLKNIDLTPAIGLPYYTTFSVGKDRVLEQVNPKALDEELLRITEISNNQDANNSTLTSYNTSQKLTGDDIKGMKAKGGDYKEVISALIDNSSSFHTKTAYSQIKYLKKKMAKHSTMIRFLRPTLKTLCECYYSKDPRKIRFDTFGQLLTLANIRAGLKVLVVETTMGLLTGAIAERMNGDGKVLSAFVGKGPSLSIAQNFGFASNVEQMIVPFSIEVLHQLNAENPADIKTTVPGTTSGGIFNQNQVEVATPLLKEGVDSLIIVTKYHPLNIVLACLPFLNPSGNIVVVSQFQQQLIECYQFLNKGPLALNLAISEIWMREQQVLPKRTHPTMNMDGSSGYLLSCIKVKTSTNTTTTTPTTSTSSTSTTTSTDTNNNDNNNNNNNNTEETVTTADAEEGDQHAMKKRKRDGENGEQDEEMDN